MLLALRCPVKSSRDSISNVSCLIAPIFWRTLMPKSQRPTIVSLKSFVLAMCSLGIGTTVLFGHSRRWRVQTWGSLFGTTAV